MNTASAFRGRSLAAAGARAGISRLALYVGLAALLGAATPAQAQFGFPWYAARPEPPVLVYPTRPPLQATLARRQAHRRGDRSIAAKPDAAHSIVGPLLIVVSVNRQRLTVYDGDRPIATSPVSTGKEGHETPYGVFSVIQKERLHRSNLYDDAPMPFMQRITWSGVALHAGPLPGRAASHGCIRLPAAFAARLWDMTKVGARVVVAHDDIVPVDFAHPRLFTVRQDTPAMPPTAAAPLDGGNSAASPAIAGRGAALEPARSSLTHRALRQVASLAEISVPQSEALAPLKRAVPELGPTGALHKAGEETSAIALLDTPPSAFAEMAPTVEEIAEAAAVDAAREAAMASSDLLLQRAAPAEPVAEHGSVAAAASPMSPSPATADLPPAEAAASPPAPAGPKAVSLGEQPTGASAAKPQPAPKKMGAISIFVSRKEKKLFVRRSFEPVFDAPVTFEGEQPVGTHIYTATNIPANGAILHWVALSVAGADDPFPMRPAPEGHARRAYPPPLQVSASGAGAALERVQLSDELRQRVESMITPGASLIVSDKGLGIETGRGTDFVILTH